MKRYLVVLSLALVGMVGVGTTLYAHHSFAATYKEDERITVEGELVQFLFRNPHSWVHVNVREKDGTVRRYAVEWAGSAQLAAQGINQQTLKVGDKVQITGSPGRSYPSTPQMRLVTMQRLDGSLEWGKKPGEVVD
jgi:hypothetical protein